MRVLLASDSLSNLDRIGPYYDGCKYTELEFFEKEWDELFCDILGWIQAKPYNSGEDVHSYYYGAHQKFLVHLGKFPQLSKIWDLFSDVSFSSQQTVILMNELVEIEGTYSRSSENRLLKILSDAAEMAINVQSGLVLGGSG
jgi:hypothetical protein